MKKPATKNPAAEKAVVVANGNGATAKSDTPAVVAPVKRARKARAAKLCAYATLNGGVVSSSVTPYADEKAMYDDISLNTSAGVELVIFREVKRGALKVKTKVSIG